MTGPMTRRAFAQQSAALAGAASMMIVPRHVLGGSGFVAPSEKLNIAGIGFGGMGAANLKNLESQNLVALCDVDPGYVAPVVKRYPSAKFYNDYRELLDKQKDIEGVVIATPDHTHAVIAMAAMRAGKHVYCQKPLTHDIHEARTLMKAARELKVTTQMGIQGHSGEGIRRVCEWIAAGLIGEVREVDAWCSLTYYPWGKVYYSSAWSERPTDTLPLPSGLNWDLWIGPAPFRPYHRAYHPLTWRCWWDFGSGMMGDRGVHTLDAVVQALKLTMPTSIDATSCGNTTEVHPLSAIVTFRFPERGDLPPVRVNWYEGTRAPMPEGVNSPKEMFPEGGAIFKGTKGAIMSGVSGSDLPKLLPAEKFKDVKLPDPTIPRVPDSHELDWVRACKENRPAGADFSYGAPLTEICLLGNIAKRVDGRILWDAEKGQVTNLPEANRYVELEYRKGWSL